MHASDRMPEIQRDPNTLWTLEINADCASILIGVTLFIGCHPQILGLAAGADLLMVLLLSLLVRRTCSLSLDV